MESILFKCRKVRLFRIDIFGMRRFWRMGTFMWENGTKTGNTGKGFRFGKKGLFTRDSGNSIDRMGKGD